MDKSESLTPENMAIKAKQEQYTQEIKKDRTDAIFKEKRAKFGSKVGSEASEELNIQMKVEKPTKAVFLIDTSGSTGAKYGEMNILIKEYQLASEIAAKSYQNKGFLMFWNSKSYLPNGKEEIDFQSFNPDLNSKGGTQLKCAVNDFPQEWFDNENVVYIITDGEINDSVDENITRFFMNDMSIYIITVEANSSDYTNKDVEAGGKLFQLLKDLGLTRKVRNFICYNFHHTDGFVNLDNPKVVKGCFPFKGKLYPNTQFDLVVEKIEEQIQECKNQKDKLEKLAFDLANTLYHLNYGEKITVQKQRVNLISRLFEETEISTKVETILNDLLLQRHMNIFDTFQDYKKNRDRLFENSQLALYSNTRKSISFVENNTYMSFPLNTRDGTQRIIVTNEENVKKEVKLLNQVFCNSGFSIGDLVLPILPTKVESDYDFHDQCVRQWLRTNYGKKYNVNAASDLILYVFLVDILKIHLSKDITWEIKKAYIDLGVIMLQRKRYATNMPEWEFLEENEPSSTKGAPLDSILKKCAEHFCNDSLNPKILWLGIILMFKEYNIENESIQLSKIIATQSAFYQPSLTAEGLNLGNLMEFLEKLNKPLEQITVKSREYDYTCCITLKDTSLTGGKIIRPHHFRGKIFCQPNFVLSQEGYEILLEHAQDLKCPICIQNMDINVFEDILPAKKEILLELIDEPFYNTSLHEKLVISNALLIDNDQSYKKLDDYKFNLTSFEIDAPVVQDSLGARSVENKTQEDFNLYVAKKYPFLKEINMENVCIAGGFCRSILLKQQLKDFDFFIYGKDHDKTFKRLLKECQVAVKKHLPDVKFLFLFKPLHNVFEIICISDPNDYLKPTFTLDNYKQYTFRGLHRFDKKMVIDVKNNRVYSLKKGYESHVLDNLEADDFSNYFEEGDLHNIRMVHRIQIILARFGTISDIFNSFDSYPSRVAYDGENTYLTEKAYISYKYMINIVNESLYNRLYNHRLSKYFTYGFNIVLPYLNMEKVQGAIELPLGDDLIFKIAHINKNVIIIHHNSQNEQKMESLRALEIENQKTTNDGYYKSSLFASLVAILRYVKINEIPYFLTPNIIEQDQDGIIQFREKAQKVEFIDKVPGRIPIDNWYGTLRDFNKKF